MERLVIIGASYRHTTISSLGKYALPKDETEHRLPQIAATIGARELAYVGTCNRIEFILVGDENTSPETYRERLTRALQPSDILAEGRKLRAWQGDGAAEHLLLVASGLDSARRGEAEIRAQVRSAWQYARRAGTCGPILDRLFTDALKTAHEVQTFISGQIGGMSLSDCALTQLKAHLGGRRANIALIGVSPMTRRCAQILSREDHTFLVASRTLETAVSLADEIGATAVQINDLKLQTRTFDVVIAATGGQEIVLKADDIKRLAAVSGLFIIDFGVPPNIDPSCADLAGIRLLDMDHIIEEARAQTSAEAPEIAMAREIIDRHLDRLRSEMALRQAGPAIKNVIAHYQSITKASIDNELGAAMPADADQERLRAWADLMARRFLHATLAGVRALATHADPAAVDAFLRGLNESLPATTLGTQTSLGDSKQ